MCPPRSRRSARFRSQQRIHNVFSLYRVLINNLVFQNLYTSETGIEIEKGTKVQLECDTKTKVSSATGIVIRNSTEIKFESETRIGIGSETDWHQEQGWDQNRALDGSVNIQNTRWINKESVDVQNEGDSFYIHALVRSCERKLVLNKILWDFASASVFDEQK
ncbi:hypothetical protein EVAR_56974_1 [Eumeta japonica]|uniref:Uncharacterized protein n=1 Tax=Eumeta variegata TaxID=151549 RepID=A0A4C1Z9A6_EUMVA|nr:hypothetical protein EVAR_56974_1 [Eumeta japonica]